MRLTLEVGGSDGIAARVASGDLDIGLDSPPTANLGLVFAPLFTEELALLAPGATRSRRRRRSRRKISGRTGCW